jgi:hypothetical protein
MAQLTGVSTPRGNIRMHQPVFVRSRLKPALMACAASLSLIGFAPAAWAQDSASGQATTVDPRLLVEQLVAEGVITREQADRMIARATVPVQAAQAQPPVPAGGLAADGTQTIPYVPQVVREQIVSQVRTELAGQAQAEGWSRPGETPEWTRRIQIYGDVRARGEGRFYEPPVFDDTGRQIGGNFTEFLDWGAINAGNGLQVNPAAPGYVNPPYLNTSEDRRRFRLRARLGVRAQIDDWISADVRIGTGNDSAPVSTNQTLGLGGTGKYQLWLDRASIRLTPIRDVNIDLGRFANPFWTSDLMFDNDMNFDGVAVSASGRLSDRLSLFGTAGAFPVFNTDLNFGSRDIGAFESTDKYLFAAQAGIEFRPADGLRARLAGGYFYYDGVEGGISSPCFWLQDVCDTDATRPSFQQFGNTVMPLRDVIPDPSAPLGTSPEVQYFGLASRFELVTARGQLEYDVSDRIGVRLEGDFVKNLAFSRSRIAPLALNNFAPVIGETGGQYDGGDIGWQGRLTVGALRMGLGQGDWSAQRGDWSVHLGYRHLESDAVIDGFADSDFGLGGTNVRGWFAGANYAIARNSFLGLRWLSSEEIAGPQLSVDRLLVDLSTKF